MMPWWSGWRGILRGRMGRAGKAGLLRIGCGGWIGVMCEEAVRMYDSHTRCDL